jgi:hypothetical protein
MMAAAEAGSSRELEEGAGGGSAAWVSVIVFDFFAALQVN